MSKKFIFITFPILLLVALYFLGPTPNKPKFEDALPSVPQDPVTLEIYIAGKEAKHKVKPDNEARIIWANNTLQKTNYSIVYLHGFGASQAEGDPIHKDFAKEFGCNLYLSRLSDHGIDTTENMLLLTADKLWKSAEEALAIGKAIGDTVIIMSTSTGGTLALMLAADYPKDVYALLNMSPNIKVFHPLAFLANNPWGLQISRLVVGSNYVNGKSKPGVNLELKKQYWYDKYRLEAVGELQEIIEDKMTKATFEKIEQPCLTLYYYKNEQEQDSTVSVPAILEMEKALGTPENLKEAIAIPTAGDHVMGSYITSKDLPSVQRQMEKFAIEKLHLHKKASFVFANPAF